MIGSPGALMPQGDHSKVRFRNIEVKARQAGTQAPPEQALLEAFSRGQTAVVQSLPAKGADPNGRGRLSPRRP